MAIGFPILGIFFIIILANTDTGRRTIEAVAAKLSHGELVLQGLSGRFPGALRLAHGEIRDQDGVWLTIDDLVLDWSPLALLHGEAKIERLAAAHVDAIRRPVSSSSSSSAPLPRLAIAALRVDRLELGPALVGTAMAVSATGKLRLDSPEDGDIALDIAQLDGPGRYIVNATLAAAGDDATLDISEPSHGPLAALVGLPDLGALTANAHLAGPRNAEQLGLAIQAGSLRGDAKGDLDLIDQNLALDLSLTAPAMRPRPDLSWRSANLDLHVHGSFTAPEAAGTFAAADLAAAGGSVGAVTARLNGNAGAVDVSAALDHVRVPGAQPDLLAAAPIAITAHAVLNQPARPVHFTLAHPLVGIEGDTELAGAREATATVSLPDLTPFARLAGYDVAGHATVKAQFEERGTTDRVTLDGQLAVTGGDERATKLLGNSATLSLAASKQDDDLTLDRLAFDGAALHAAAQGSETNGRFDVGWSAGLSDVVALVPTLSGPLTLEGRVQGAQDNLSLTMQGHGNIAAAGVRPGAITLSLSASGLPAQPTARLDVQGQLADAPLSLSAALRRDDDGTTQLTLDEAHWKSLTGQGTVTLATDSIFPAGHMQFHAARLADLAPLLGMPIGGSVDATLDTAATAGRPQARVHAEARQLEGFGDRAERATLEATVDDPQTHPVAAMQMVLSGITAANGITGTARIDVHGPEEALAVRLSSDLNTAQGAAQIRSAGIARLPQRALDLQNLQADYRGETIRLLGPAHLRFANGIAIDNLRIGTGGTSLTIAGEMSPRLDLSVALRNATPALAKPFFPNLNGSGTLNLDARLGGTLAAPTGTIRAVGRALHVRTGPGGAVPAANLDATAQLSGTSARIDARVVAGADLRLQLTGTVPTKTEGAIDLHASGLLDLVMLDPILTAAGRSVHGQVTLDLGLAGTLADPRATGSARIANGALNDYVQGVSIDGISGIVMADGDTLRLTQLSGRAGNGTIAINGTVGVAAPMPVALTVTARNARPLSSDLLTATLDANLTVSGSVAGALAVGGRVHVDRADIQIPDSLPQSVAVLDVKKPGQKAPPPPAAPIALNLTIDAPEQVFVRGHGLDAEMGGTLRLAGNSQTPQIGGGFDLRHGAFSLAGQTLNFTSGRVAFDGYGLSHKLDPTLDFVAQSTANSVTATLTITGYADVPKIRLSSAPDLPQDEILAQLLFGQSVKQLTPFQVVEIAQALAAISGIGGAASDPLAAVRKGLGLDRLSVGAASGSGPGATVEAGKYIANGIYVGTKQGTSGGTQAQVQVDLTKHLKLQTTLGTGGQPATGSAVTPDNDPGSSIGLTYQFEY